MFETDFHCSLEKCIEKKGQPCKGHVVGSGVRFVSRQISVSEVSVYVLSEF